MNNYNSDILEIKTFRYFTDYLAENNIGSDRRQLQNNDFYEIFLMLEGTASCFIGNTVYDLRSTQALIVPPQHKYLILPNAHNETNSIFRGITLQLKLLPSAYTKYVSFMNYPNVITCNSSPEIITHIHTIVHMYAFLEREEFDVLIKGLATQLVMLLYKYHSLNDTKTDNLNFLTIHTLSYINQHLTEKITLKTLSSFFKFNENYISRTFKKDMNTTVMQYIKGRRMQLAKTLIYGGEKPIQAMYKSGFTDYSNFYRDFVKRYGVTPKQMWIKYRKETPC